jgi:hypothetical protein
VDCGSCGESTHTSSGAEALKYLGFGLQLARAAVVLAVAAMPRRLPANVMTLL